MRDRGSRSGLPGCLLPVSFMLGTPITFSKVTGTHTMSPNHCFRTASPGRAALAALFSVQLFFPLPLSPRTLPPPRHPQWETRR